MCRLGIKSLVDLTIIEGLEIVCVNFFQKQWCVHWELQDNILTDLNK